MQARIDDAAKRAGRDPAAVNRVVNVASLEGEPDGWADQLLRIADLGFDGMLLLVRPDGDAVGLVRRIGEEVAPSVRERGG
jgi:alkanesulfonate monooxygenase SsuD/methylene tetrahydromethanopterin reductase-like flavin-dependent oxidoreductase (luciferase family)